MRRESRRSFLRRTSQLGLASAFVRAFGAGRAARGVGAAPASRASDWPTTLPALASRPSTGPIDPSLKSIVAHVRREQVTDGQKIHETLLGEMVEDGLLSCCVGRGLVPPNAGPGEAWNALFTSDDVIGIKFNQVGAEVLGTTVALAKQLVKSLVDRAGFAPERIVLIEAPNHPELRELKTRPRAFGWSGGEVSFGSGTEQLAAVLDEITALINVPFLKSHNVAGMTGCLKNLSHAFIRRPGRYHANACTPFVGDIVALPQIRSKLRIHVVDALRVVFDGGPAARPGGIAEHRGILVSTDPVAADSVGIEIINDHRARAKLPPIGDANAHVPHVHAAAQVGLGTDDQDFIKLREPPVE